MKKARRSGWWRVRLTKSQGIARYTGAMEHDDLASTMICAAGCALYTYVIVIPWGIRIIHGIAALAP